MLAAAGFGISITLVGVAGLANLGHAGTLAVSVLAIGTAAGSGFVLRRRLLKTERFVIDALKAYERGERRTEALRVSSRGAPATEAWNEIIGNRGELEIERVRIESLRAAVEAGGPRPRGGG
ncbi:MAG: hypothetical protein CMJ31_06550, partial [Phycisphaerae bacterium]|nr:hypothetical protein [Phycisphaerae bacterium]